MRRRTVVAATEQPSPRPMPAAELSRSELLAGAAGDDLTGVEWPDGVRQCRFAVLAGALHGSFERARVLTEQAVACDSCADHCGG